MGILYLYFIIIMKLSKSLIVAALVGAVTIE